MYRGQIPSPARPTVAWRGDWVVFWAAIARGVKTEEAAAEAGISFPVVFRWFPHAGGVSPCLPPIVTGRFLSFTERGDIAIWHARGAGVRDIARHLGRGPSTVSRELRRNASTHTYRLQYKASTVARRAVPAGRRSPRSSVTSGCATMSRGGCPALCGHPTARLVGAWRRTFVKNLHT